MTKAKKAELSIEEKLQAAFVPENEQPYPVPENWCWTRLGEITSIIGGGTPSSSIAEYYDGGKIPWISPADLSGYNEKYISEGAKNITTLGLEKSSARLMPEGTVCLSSRAPIGYVVIARNSLCTNQGFKSFLPSKVYIPEYLYWYLKGNKELLESYASGTTFLELSGSKASKVEIPIAPFKEQQRIIDRIESLFAKLDEAKEKAQAALDSFEMRKAAILHQAFTGELTAQWRKEHGVGMESWKRNKLEDVCEKIVCGKTPKEYITLQGDVPYLKVYNIVDNEIDFSKKQQFIPNEIHDGKLKSSRLNPKDVIMNIVGPPLRKIAIVTDQYPEWNMNQAIVRFRTKKNLDYKFLYYALLNPETLNDVIQQTKGVVGQANISVTQSRNLEILIPSSVEQNEIVIRVEKIMNKGRHAQSLVQSVLNKIDLLKKSILARAFSGELGTNDPAEENARELLKKVL